MYWLAAHVPRAYKDKCLETTAVISRLKALGSVTAGAGLLLKTITQQGGRIAVFGLQRGGRKATAYWW